MRSMRLDNAFGTAAMAGTKDDGICESTHAAGDLNWSASGKIKDTQFKGPSRRIPDPTSLKSEIDGNRCTMGQYTNVNHIKVNTMVGKIRARSATDPSKMPIATAANWL